MIDKSSLLKSQGSLYLEFIPKDRLFHKMLLLSLMGFLTGWCNLYDSKMGDILFFCCLSWRQGSTFVTTTAEEIPPQIGFDQHIFVP